MKNPIKRHGPACPEARSRQRRQAGFALVVSLVLMVLLTVLGMGLLTLSTVSLRGSATEECRVRARANARMALMLAIGDLQKTLGPDKAVSAGSEISQASPAKPGLMGVWKSWDYTANLQGGTPPDYIGEKKSRFLEWLVSSANSEDTHSPDFATTPWSNATIRLAGASTYGGTLPAKGPVLAGKVLLTDRGSEQGAYAWHVSDESTKARINLYRDPSRNSTLSEKRSLLAGHRPDFSAVGGSLALLPKDTTFQDYDAAKNVAARITSIGQAELSQANGLGKLKSFRDEITPYSLGVLADVRSGGLKKDLSSIFELSRSPSTITLPAEFTNQGLYASTLQITGDSDPLWSRLSSCYNTFKQLSNPDTAPIYDKGALENILLPKAGQKPVQPKLFAPGPVIAKVQVLFSVLTRPVHAFGPDNGTDGQLHLIYTPVVTLYNPYNVKLSFDMLQVTFHSLPVGFNFLIDGTSVSGGRLVPFNQLYDPNRTNGAIEKSIVLKISNWKSYDKTVTEISGSKSESDIIREADLESSDPKDPIIMNPGETLLCSPYIDPNSEFGRSGSPNTFFDFGNQLTRSIKTRPGFFGNTVGYDVDWLSGNNVVRMKRRPQAALIGVICGAAKPTLGGDASFEIEAEITVSGRRRAYGGIQMIYPDLGDLQKTLKEAQISTNALDSFVPNEGGGDALISQHSKAKPFALFTASARTTSGGVNEAGVRATTSMPGNALVNGVYAGKPYLFNNGALPVVVTNLKNEKLGAQSYELSLTPVTKSTLVSLLQVDATNRSRFVTGNTASSGIKAGSCFEIAGGPLQAISDFRRTNVLASGFAPAMAEPIAGSIVPPVMSTGAAWQQGPSYRLFDHSVLANHALFDGFYFSTFATNGTATPEQAFSRFVAGGNLLSQSFTPHLRAGETTQKAQADLFSNGLPKESTYLKAAKYQMVCGAFNVNSTSVLAWKAKLSSMRNSNVPVFSSDGGSVKPVDSADTPILSMTMPNDVALNSSLDPASDGGRQNRWNGFRQLTNSQLDELAVCIVREVRKRGPFLSMSEFVNRRIGPNAEETRQGALEAAIAAAKLNDSMFTEQLPIRASDLTGAEYGFTTPEVVTGNPAAGAPGWISQGDLLKILEPAATVRPDTFVIRVCGEATMGDRKSRAFAEAVVQRMPEYVDPSQDPAENAYSGSNVINKIFGRRMEIVSFRWLSEAEI